MATRTAPSRSARRTGPYKDSEQANKDTAPASSRTTTTSTSVTKSSTSEPTLSNQETMRDYLRSVCNERFPQYTPKNDFELVVIAGATHLEDESNQSLASYASEELEFSLSDGYRPSERKKGLAIIMADMKAICDGPPNVTGRKPKPGDEDVHVHPIPESDLSIRVWGKDMEPSGEYCLDFVRTATGEPVNAPPEYELWAVPNPDAPWLPYGSAKLSSLERAFGIAQEDIKPGMETFVLLEGTIVCLKRSGKPDMHFLTPTRPRPVETPDYLRNLIIL